MTTPTIQPRVTEYTVNALPDDHDDASLFAITVTYRGHGKWAIRRYSRCLSANGTWNHEPIPSECTDEWLSTHRFDEQTALRLAVEAAPQVRVNGWTVQAVLADHTGGQP